MDPEEHFNFEKKKKKLVYGKTTQTLYDLRNKNLNAPDYRSG